MKPGNVRGLGWFGFVVIAGLGCGPVLAQELQPLYVPLVFATIGATADPGGHFVDTASWRSSMSAFNPTDSPVSVVDVAVYGKGAILSPAAYPPIPPHRGGGFVPSVVPQPDRGVGFLELRTSPGVVFYANVQRVTQRCEIGAPNCVSFVLGAANIPFYRALFPAGSVAVSGAVDLGQFGLSDVGYAPALERRRRMNVTLFNAGDVSATFVVRTFPHHFSATPLTEQTVVVEAKDVFQVNGFPVPTESSLLLSAFDGNQIWVMISADQPFLSYVSTVFNAVVLGDLPFQVYPSYLQN
jgi:hypothetical protein